MEEKEKKCTCSPESQECTCEESCTCGTEIDHDSKCHEEECDCGCNQEQEYTCECEAKQDDDCDCEDYSCGVEKKDHKKEKKEKKDKAKKENSDLKEQIKSLEKKVLSEKAELINYRKRKDDEVRYMLKYSNEDMVKEILPIVDNFERAIKLDDDNLEDNLSKFLEGFKMIYCHLIQALETSGVKAIDGNNKTFDPTYHEAIMTEAKEGMESGMVLEVMQKGYLLKDKVIRPAMVKVSE